MRKNRIYKKNTATACFIVSSAILLLNAEASPRLLKTDIDVMITTANVVIFMPPAVDPGAPPTSISPVIIAMPVSDIFVRSAVLNPAVLGVTD